MLPPQVYEERRGHYERRVEAMLRYAEEGGNCCRSRLLLQYFGEEADEDCGICDVCKRKSLQSQAKDEYEALRNHILGQLQQGPHSAFDLDLAGFNPGLLEEVIDRMRAAGEIFFDGPLLKVSQ